MVVMVVMVIMVVIVVMIVMVVMLDRAAFANLAMVFNALPEMPMVATMEDKTPWKMKTENNFWNIRF